jgi:hypothetical protein
LVLIWAGIVTILGDKNTEWKVGTQRDTRNVNAIGIGYFVNTAISNEFESTDKFIVARTIVNRVGTRRTIIIIMVLIGGNEIAAAYSPLVEGESFYFRYDMTPCTFLCIN